eukprot:COSAG06_NODE_4233_length_4446_cov_6.373821_4_plen_214_part_00
MDTDNELVIRLTAVRQGVQLIQPSIRLQSCDIRGVYADLPMKGTQEGYCWVPPTCVTIRHAIDQDSPLHSSNSGKGGINVVTCSVTAVDAVSGAPVIAAIAYVSTDQTTGPAAAVVRPYSHNKPKLVWDAKFMDMMNFGESATAHDDNAKSMVTLMDNISRVVKNDNTLASSTLSTGPIVVNDRSLVDDIDIEAPAVAANTQRGEEALPNAVP